LAPQHPVTVAYIDQTPLKGWHYILAEKDNNPVLVCYHILHLTETTRVAISDLFTTARHTLAQPLTADDRPVRVIAGKQVLLINRYSKTITEATKTTYYHQSGSRTVVTRAARY